MDEPMEDVAGASEGLGGCSSRTVLLEAGLSLLRPSTIASCTTSIVDASVLFQLKATYQLDWTLGF